MSLNLEVEKVLADGQRHEHSVDENNHDAERLIENA